MKARQKPDGQFELRQPAEVFEFMRQDTGDELREILDRLREAEARAAVREYELKMQRIFSACPGFVGGDAPASEKSKGYVVIDPSRITEALAWLKRRFVVNEVLELDAAAGGLRAEIMPRAKGLRRAGGGRSLFAPPQQFQLDF